ncbi:hypothetical protein VIBNISO65_1280001 [Vibrio nigripulchritudo SO65]|nr:hypothetical protein VIBNIAM115_1230001 [Vibrio nigripulchritudo AM115]CCN44697.1 hypothetical protein VIBNIFTn2_890001 [Vibrio nigripulchritudo FTn2]CCN63033.1 hypothetical protein VIBNIPon4_1070059 [Vibrio nigripulchritudo POn4]CCN75090.1 hypothetical protein VIBNISO65_1280001 [Vibrio nigripulchritudo SO65]
MSESLLNLAEPSILRLLGYIIRAQLIIHTLVETHCDQNFC